jgi:hypothetical protein
LSEHHADLVGSDVLIIRRRPPDEVVELGRHLDSRETSAGDHEGEEALPNVGIRFDGGFLQRMENMVAQRKGVPQVLERQGMFLESWNLSKTRGVAEGHDEMVIVQSRGLVVHPRGGDDRSSAKVDLLDFPGVQPHSRAEPPDRNDRVQNSDAAGDDLGKQRLEDEVVLAINEGDLDAWITPEAFAQGHCRIDPPEAAAEDEDSERLSFDQTAPPELDQPESCGLPRAVGDRATPNENSLPCARGGGAGKSKVMPAFKGKLKEEEAKELVMYVRSFVK